jgi:CRISPR-associated protein Cmr2
MNYDFYTTMRGSNEQNVDELVAGTPQGINIPNMAARIRLLASISAENEEIKEYAIAGRRNHENGYKSLVHARATRKSLYAQELIEDEYRRLSAIGLLKPSITDFQQLPLGSWFLQFEFTLVKPWISKDDDPFYVADSVNPVRKDKVFKVPMMAASGWKGLLRWTAMYTRLAIKKHELSIEEFAQERFIQTLLFGDEKGEEPGSKKDFAKYVNGLKPEAQEHYERIVGEYYHLSPNDALPHHKGRLMFYATFFDSIDVEVINPHSRKTRAGTHPIYLECVPVGGKGTFSLLYLPFDLIGRNDWDDAKIKEQASNDLKLATEAVMEMMLTYGFSAKRTSGYGTAEDVITGKVETIVDEWISKSFAELDQEVANVRF